MIPGVVGLLVAMAVGLATFGHLDGMTIGFGGSLISHDRLSHARADPVESLAAGRDSLERGAAAHGPLVMAALHDQ
jgi:hypothetical protein